MSISRNAPCPCGSGKKYKRCCADVGKYTFSTAKKNSERRGSKFEDVLQDVFSNQEDMDNFLRMYNAQQKNRTKMLENHEHVKKYKKARQMHQEISDAMISFNVEGKFNRKVAPTSEADKHAVDYRPEPHHLKLINCEFDLSSELGYRVFYDTLIYKHATNQNCITEEFIASNRYQKPEEIEFLHSMLNSVMGLFKIIKVEEDLAYVTLQHVFTGEKFKIVDFGLSGSMNINILGIYIYTRIITYDGVSFGTGLNMTFGKNDNFIRNFIAQEKKDYRPLGELVRLTTLYNWQSKVGSGQSAVGTDPFER